MSVWSEAVLPALLKAAITPLLDERAPCYLLLSLQSEWALASWVPDAAGVRDLSFMPLCDAIKAERERNAGDSSRFPKSPPGFIVATMPNPSAAVSVSTSPVPASPRSTSGRAPLTTHSGAPSAAA